jgi:UDP:flavonoid glycosyltransferase YjiC (YdhE family)
VGTALVVDDLSQAAHECRPDLIVFDPVMYAAPLVAKKLGIVAVQHTVGLMTDALTLELVADAVSPIWREFGCQVPVAAGMFDGPTVAVCPPSLDPVAADRPRVISMRPTGLPRKDAPPLPGRFVDAGRPLVYLTLGTFSNSREMFQLVLDALANEPVNILVTVGRDCDPSTLDADASSVHVVQFLPQPDVLPHCAAVVHHAGAGTAFGVLAHGLPTVALPQSADNFAIGDRLAASGAARVLRPGEVTSDAVLAAVRTVLANNAYRDAARRIAMEIAAMPPPEDVAQSLTSFAATARAG